MLALKILSVNVGLPRPIGADRNGPILSGIRKQPAGGVMLQLGPTQLEGDGQADRTVHGDIDKAVYAYSSDHWIWWTEKQGLACGPATFGENLTVAGASEDDVRIGDLFSWGEALLEISQPRQPCFKLGLHLGRTDIAPVLVSTARCGWYFRVRHPGRVPVQGGVLHRTETRVKNPSVRQIFQDYYSPKLAWERFAELAETPRLAEVWRQGFLAKAAARKTSI